MIEATKTFNDLQHRDSLKIFPASFHLVDLNEIVHIGLLIKFQACIALAHHLPLYLLFKLHIILDMSRQIMHLKGVKHLKLLEVPIILLYCALLKFVLGLSSRLLQERATFRLKLSCNDDDKSLVRVYHFMINNIYLKDLCLTELLFIIII